jgi:hypothetical protein
MYVKETYENKMYKMDVRGKRDPVPYLRRTRELS